MRIRASTRPTDSRTDVAGGTFEAVEGGRQLMPIPERPVDVPAPQVARQDESISGTAGADGPTREPPLSAAPR